MTTATAPYPEGTLLRVTGYVEGFDARVGTQFEVEDYVSAEDAEDGVAFYWGSTNGNLNNVTAAASAVELVKTAEQMRDRSVPTPTAMAHALGLSLLGDHGLLEADETEVDDDCVLIYGETPDGLRAEVRVKVVSVYRVDL